MEATACKMPLLDKVHNALSNSPYFPKSNFTVEADEGHVKIEGTVGSFYQKQMAQELLRRLDGVERVDNALQVNWN